jgi:hypothetical protein
MNKDSERRRRRFACNGEVNFTHHKQNATFYAENAEH